MFLTRVRLTRGRSQRPLLQPCITLGLRQRRLALWAMLPCGVVLVAGPSLLAWHRARALAAWNVAKAAACGELLARHRGQLSIESELGKGATFAVSLPLSGEA